MPPSRVRTGILAGLLGLVAVLGVVWLVTTATTDGERTSGDGTPTTSAATPTGTDTDTGTETGTGTGTDTGTGTGTATGTATAGGRTSDGDGDGDGEDGGRKSIEVNGLRIDGTGMGDGCMTFINKTATAATIESVSFAVVAQPPGAAQPAVWSDNGAHCYGEGDELDDPCDGYRLIEGGQCTAGAVLAQGAAPGEYTISGVAHYSFLCDNAEISPCNDERIDWGGRLPSPQEPVLVRGASEPLTTPLDVPGGPEPDGPPEPDSPPTSESSPQPDAPPPVEPE
jgi:hypothetical protein